MEDLAQWNPIQVNLSNPQFGESEICISQRNFSSERKSASFKSRSHRIEPNEAWQTQKAAICTKPHHGEWINSVTLPEEDSIFHRSGKVEREIIYQVDLVFFREGELISVRDFPHYQSNTLMKWLALFSYSDLPFWLNGFLFNLVSLMSDNGPCSAEDMCVGWWLGQY